MVRVNLYLTEKQIERLQKAGKLSELVRRAVDEYLERMDNKNAKPSPSKEYNKK